MVKIGRAEHSREQPRPCMKVKRPCRGCALVEHTQCMSISSVASITPALSGGACVWAPPQLCVARAPCSFGFLARHIGANFQDACAHPVLPEEQRSQGNMARTNQVSIEAVKATLTHEEQSLVGAIALTSMPAPGTRLAGGVGMHFHCRTACQQCLVGKIAVQFGKAH